MKLIFLSLASGSSGNCYYLGTETHGILIDAGIGARTIKKNLKERGIDFAKVSGVLITHDHADHIKSVGGLGDKYNLPIFATEKVHNAIDENHYVQEKFYQSRRIIEKESPFTIKDFTITAFDVPHDSTDNVGYQIEYGEHVFTVLTDVGHITETVSRYICRATRLIIETNYDKDMLNDGYYPDFLKERIAGETGHLSNAETAEFLASNYSPHLKDVWLCHLSKDNNHPDLSYKTVTKRLSDEGIRVGKDVSVHVLKRNSPSEIFVLE